jgi:uncharacterized protein YciI
MHYLLFYDVVTDYVTKRVPFRSAHLAYAQRAVERGELVLAGALANPPDTAPFSCSGAPRRRSPKHLPQQIRMF